jgi:hypothetical protein
MSALRRTLGRIRCFFDKPPLDADLEAEIAAHIELAILNRLFGRSCIQSSRFHAPSKR